ncbi:MAG: Nif11-like leader peptide family natural product precursor [Rhabdochlamydiaceae bacterium]|nr:Nif11-like leader peptide family natural product precursor [Rhabdochlamydiaceae bacterium]
MSKHDASAFLDKWEKDKSFANSVRNAETVEQRRAILKKTNLHFTKEEYREAYQEKYHKKLSDAELNKILAAGKRAGKLGPNENTAMEIN